jgi:hypothetical protein
MVDCFEQNTFGGAIYKRRPEYLAQLMLHDDPFDWPENRSGAYGQM